MKEKYEKILKLEDLKVGMEVSMQQLLQIYNTYMYLSNTHFDDEIGEIVGVLEYFGDKSVEEAGFKLGEVLVIYVPVMEGMKVEDYE